MLNLENLETVDTVNSRISYDLRYSGKTGKFTLGQDTYMDLNIDDNGFQLIRDKESNQPVLKVVANEEATVHAGRTDATQKGKTFTANALATMLGVSNDSAEFDFEKHDINGDLYLTMVRTDEEDSEDLVSQAEEANVPEEEPQAPRTW